MQKKFKPQQGVLLPYYYRNGKTFHRATDGEPLTPTFSQAMDYSCLLFEGIRVNINEQQHCYAFRMKDHIKRLLYGWKSLGFSSPVSEQQLFKGICEGAQKNLAYLQQHGELTTLYVRPKIFVSDASIKPFSSSGSEVVVEYFPMGNYVSTKGVSATFADYVRTHRYSQYTTKGAGKYPEYARLRDSTDHRYDDVFQLGLGKGGRLIFTEGTTNNVFFVKDGELFTPGDDDFLLHGITRDSVVVMAAHLGIRTHKKEVPLSFAIECDEIFVTGTASFIVPVTQLGRFKIGIGPVTKKLMSFFQRVRTGKEKKFLPWLTRIIPRAP